MAKVKRLPQLPRLKSQECPKSNSGQHRFQGFPYSQLQRCSYCGRTREEVYGK
jgi:hypothetical protein